MTMRNAFPRVYKSFQEFEREELRKLDTASTLDDMLDDLFADELDFDAPKGKSRRIGDDD
jgi:hypothetical protein